MLGINTIKEILVSSTSVEPQRIDFVTAGKTVYGAEVIETEWFCDTWNFKVKYTFTAYDGTQCQMTQWVTLAAVK